AVRGRSAQSLVVDGFSDGGFNKITARKENASGFIDDKRFITHNGEVRASRHTTSHNCGDLGDSHAAHYGIVAEDSAKVFFIGEDFVLHRQIDSGAVDQVEDWKTVFNGDFLRAKVFLSGYREPRSGLNGGIIG